MHPSEAKRILDRTECPFSWEFRCTGLGLSGVGDYRKGLMRKFRSYLEDPGAPSYKPKWYVRVLLTYILFRKGDVASALKEIDSALEDLLKAEDRLSQKYKVSCLHIVLASKAWLMFETKQNVEEIVNMIPPKENMSNLEKAGLVGFKSNIIWDLAGKLIYQAIPFSKEAMALDPDEYEWKISTVSILVRYGRYTRKDFERRGIEYIYSERDIQERLEMIERMLNDGSLSTEQTTATKYYKAETLADFVLNRRRDPKVEDCCRQVDNLWREILEASPENSTYCEFGAKWFFRKGHQDLGLIFHAIQLNLERGVKNGSIRKAARIAMNHPSTCEDRVCVAKYSGMTRRIAELVNN